MKSNQKILLTIGITFVLLLVFFFITNAITKYTGFVAAEDTLDDFQRCLREQNLNLYINTQDVSKTLTSMEVFDYLQYFEINNCLINNQPCLDSEIESFPTWIINGDRVQGKLELSKLTKSAGCEILNQNK